MSGKGALLGAAIYSLVAFAGWCVSQQKNSNNDQEDASKQQQQQQRRRHDISTVKADAGNASSSEQCKLDDATNTSRQQLQHAQTPNITLTPVEAAMMAFDLTDEKKAGVVDKKALLATIKLSKNLRAAISPKLETCFEAFAAWLDQLHTEEFEKISREEWANALDRVTETVQEEAASPQRPSITKQRLSLSPFDSRRLVDQVD